LPKIYKVTEKSGAVRYYDIEEAYGDMEKAINWEDAE